MAGTRTDHLLRTTSELSDQFEVVKSVILDELDAIEDERGRLVRALGHLDGAPPVERPASPVRRERPRRSKDQWEQQLLAELRKAPGTVGDLTLRMGLKPGSTKLFAIAKSVHEKGLAEKDGAVYSLATEKPKTKAKPRRAKAKAKASAS